MGANWRRDSLDRCSSTGRSMHRNCGRWMRNCGGFSGGQDWLLRSNLVGVLYLQSRGNTGFPPGVHASIPLTGTAKLSGTSGRCARIRRNNTPEVQKRARVVGSGWRAVASFLQIAG